MADIPEVKTTEPTELLGVGRRHLAVRDYSSAVSCLGQACEILAQKFGQQADECGEAYLWYGKSLLGLAREESGVLGDGIPQGGEDEDGDEGGEEDNEMEDDKASEDKDEPSKGDKEEVKEPTQPSEVESKNNDEKMEEEQSTSNSEPKQSTCSEVPGSSSDGPKNAEEDEEEADEDDVENLQVAWEVLELARDIFLKRGEAGKKELADVYLHLGEVSLESETYDKAVIDMGKSLELFKELYSDDDRRIAETHYQIGLAHSLSNGFDDAITHFKTAAEILESRIKALESPTVTKDDENVKKYLASDPFYSVEGEIKELKELLPEIHEKIQDMIDYKAEAIKSVRESLGISTNGESSKTNGSCSKVDQDKKASDISHLVKRKRKSDETGAEETSVAKKVAQ